MALAASGSGGLVVAAALSRSVLSVCWLCAWRVARSGVLVLRGGCGGCGGVHGVHSVRCVRWVRCVRVSRGRRAGGVCGAVGCAGWRLPSFSAVRSEERERGRDMQGVG